MACLEGPLYYTTPLMEDVRLSKQPLEPEGPGWTAKMGRNIRDIIEFSLFSTFSPPRPLWASIGCLAWVFPPPAEVATTSQTATTHSSAGHVLPIRGQHLWFAGADTQAVKRFMFRSTWVLPSSFWKKTVKALLLRVARSFSNFSILFESSEQKKKQSLQLPSVFFCASADEEMQLASETSKVYLSMFPFLWFAQPPWCSATRWGELCKEGPRQQSVLVKDQNDGKTGQEEDKSRQILWLQLLSFSLSWFLTGTRKRNYLDLRNLAASLLRGSSPKST